MIYKSQIYRQFARLKVAEFAFRFHVSLRTARVRFASRSVAINESPFLFKSTCHSACAVVVCSWSCCWERSAIGLTNHTLLQRSIPPFKSEWRAREFYGQLSPKKA